MIKRLVINKLFGRFDYDICFNEDILTILTGPNGYGKSTVLKIIEALNKFNIAYFNTIKFIQIDVYFKDKEEPFKITKVSRGIKINNGIFEKSMNFSERDEYYKYYLMNKFNRNHIESLTLEEIYRYNYHMERMKIIKNNKDIKDDNYNKWLHMAKTIKSKNKKNKANGFLLDTILKMRECTEKVYFIKEQRLIREEREEDRTKVINVIEDIPNKFKMIMSNLSENYSQKANQLDSSYPNRLFNTEKGITEKEYHDKMKEMSVKFQKLKEYDISDMTIFSNVVFKDEHAKALKIYFDDFNEKYKVYEEYIKMYDLYSEIVNQRLSFKKINISKDKGLSVYDIDNKNEVLNLNELSSGEKQEIVLFFELIFDTPNDILLLIDEPEISLHISWQKKFIDDLLKIVEYKNFNIIVATHSPQIISNHWDKQIDLGELYGH